MRKTAIIGISILSVFILCSLSYQPIIADAPIENIAIIKKSKASDVDELEELYTKLIEMKSQSNDDCGCNNANTRWNFPIICSFLGVFLLITMILCISLNLREFCDISMKIYDIMESLNCGVTI